MYVETRFGLYWRASWLIALLMLFGCRKIEYTSIMVIFHAHNEDYIIQKIHEDSGVPCIQRNPFVVSMSQSDHSAEILLASWFEGITEVIVLM